MLCRNGTTNASFADYRTLKDIAPMKKLLSTLGLFFMLAFTLTGCELYFGKSKSGGDDEGRPPGWNCTSNAECAAGCYCEVPAAGQQGECAEAGFCDQDSDCPAGYVCDDRSSCVPGGTTPPKPECSKDSDCDDGYVCTNGACTSTFTCGGDGLAPNSGCSKAMPTCPLGGVALIDKATGCYTGDCGNILTCDVAPRCQNLQYRDDCLARQNGQLGSDCTEVRNGINCTNPSTGQACQDGDVGCVCQSTVYASCAPKNLM